MIVEEAPQPAMNSNTMKSFTFEDVLDTLNKVEEAQMNEEVESGFAKFEENRLAQEMSIEEEPKQAIQREENNLEERLEDTKGKARKPSNKIDILGWLQNFMEQDDATK
jgi:hypothetical protein